MGTGYSEPSGEDGKADALQAGGGSEEVNLLGELLLQLILLVHIQVGLLKWC